MSVDVGVSAANEYFKATAHLLSARWNAADGNQKQAALTMARRQVERAAGADLDELPEASGRFHPARAVFEQACWLLANALSVPDGTQAGPRWATVDPDTGEARKPEEARKSGLCAEADAWIAGALRPRIVLVRG